MVAAGFLSHCLNGCLPYVRHCIVVNEGENYNLLSIVNLYLVTSLEFDCVSTSPLWYNAHLACNQYGGLVIKLLLIKACQVSQ